MVTTVFGIKMDAEFLHHIYLLKVDGGLSF